MIELDIGKSGRFELPLLIRGNEKNQFSGCPLMKIRLERSGRELTDLNWLGAAIGGNTTVIRTKATGATTMRIKPYGEECDTNAVDGNWDSVDRSLKLNGGVAEGDSGMVWQQVANNGTANEKTFTYILADVVENGQILRRLSIEGPDGGVWVQGWQAGQLRKLFDVLRSTSKTAQRRKVASHTVSGHADAMLWRKAA